ncbi:MAG: SH3 domain-containing protein, partial [Planctomycetota bacterium]
MKKRIILLGLMGLWAVIGSLSLWADEPEYVAEVTVNKLFVRTGPAANYADINVARKGEKLVVLEEKSGWLKVELPEDTT